MGAPESPLPPSLVEPPPQAMPIDANASANNDDSRRASRCFEKERRVCGCSKWKEPLVKLEVAVLNACMNGNSVSGKPMAQLVMPKC